MSRHYRSVVPAPPFVPVLWFMRVDNGKHEMGQRAFCIVVFIDCRAFNNLSPSSGWGECFDKGMEEFICLLASGSLSLWIFAFFILLPP